VFEPPFALPHRGKFFFDIQADTYSAFPILAATTNPYPDGEGWGTGPEWDCSRPADARAYLPHPDLVFRVELCSAPNGGAGEERSEDRLRLEATPNPASRQMVLTLREPRDGRCRAVVAAIYGRTAYSVVRLLNAGTHHLNVDGSRLAAGLYFVRLVGPGRAAKTARVVVVR